MTEDPGRRPNDTPPTGGPEPEDWGAYRREMCGPPSFS